MVNITALTVQDTRFCSTVSNTKKKKKKNSNDCLSNAKQMEGNSLKRDIFALTVYKAVKFTGSMLR